MRRLEKLLASKMLEMASDTYSNFGCNDYDLVKDGGLTPEEAVVFTRRFHEWNGDPEEYDPKRLLGNDSAIMSYLAHLLKEDQ